LPGLLLALPDELRPLATICASPAYYMLFFIFIDIALAICNSFAAATSLDAALFLLPYAKAGLATPEIFRADDFRCCLLHTLMLCCRFRHSWLFFSTPDKVAAASPDFHGWRARCRRCCSAA